MSCFKACTKACLVIWNFLEIFMISKISLNLQNHTWSYQQPKVGIMSANPCFYVFWSPLATHSSPYRTLHDWQRWADGQIDIELTLWDRRRMSARLWHWRFPKVGPTTSYHLGYCAHIETSCFHNTWWLVSPPACWRLKIHPFRAWPFCPHLSDKLGYLHR